MKTTHVPLDAAFVWCSVQTRDGQTAYFGTGDQGKIFAVDTKAPHAGDEKPARKVADLDAAWVTALAVRNDGTLLAGTTPGGRIYSVDPKTGNAHEWTTLSADHVWSLVYDARTGVTYAGTGSPGKVFAIDDKGHARELWDSGDKHVVSLAQEPGGTRALLAGTSEEAILYRVSLEGRAEALQDFEAEEVRAIAPTRDAIYVAVNDFEKGSPAGGGRAGRREGNADHADRRGAVVGGIAAAAGTAQGQGRALSPRARRAHRADLLAQRRIPDRGAARRRRDARRRRRIDHRRGRRLRRHRHAGQGLPRLQGSHRRAGAGSARAPGAGAGARRRQLPRRHRRHRRRLPRAALGGRGCELSVQGARRRVPVALGHAALARHAEPGGRDALGEHRQARRELERLAQARSHASRERRVGRPCRQPRRALSAVSRRPGERGRAPARCQHLLRAAEPARARHRADAGRSVATVVLGSAAAAPSDRARIRRC